MPDSAASAPSAPPASPPASPTTKFAALAGIAAVSAVAVFTSVNSSMNDFFKRTDPIIPAHDTSTNTQGVVARMNQFFAARELPKVLQPYDIQNPVTGEKGVLEVVNFKDNCFHLLVGGAGLTTSSQRSTEGTQVFESKPYKFCAAPKTTGPK